MKPGEDLWKISIISNNRWAAEDQGRPRAEKSRWEELLLHYEAAQASYKTTATSYTTAKAQNYDDSQRAIQHALQNLAKDRVAEVGWISWTAKDPTKAFVEHVFANFRDKNVVFVNFCDKNVVIVNFATLCDKTLYFSDLRDCYLTFWYFVIHTCIGVDQIGLCCDTNFFVY